MDYRKLGSTDIEVSVICLGTMTWGEQNTEAEAHAQLDYALAHGVNFIDTAELYAIPPRAETYGLTERYIGSWLKKAGQRDRVVLATKIAGPGEDWVEHIRGGRSRFDRANIEAAIEASLRRLQTDYIDLYQLHWPDRNTNFFGQLGYTHDPDENPAPMDETLEVLDDLVNAGKIRYVGISNETPWGAMRYLQLSAARGLPRVVSIQNPYNLLNRSFEVGLAELAIREQLGLLAYSPLGFGVLSGKYLGGERPAGARLTLFPDYTRYSSANADAATQAYVDLAHDNGLDPAQMALAYVNSRPFLTSTIIGATTMAQLDTDIASANVTLSAQVLKEIENIHERWPNPSP
ncbi:MAG: NADP(H)-dependent aldo-keto reductase [Pseudomonadota bacterium]|nr:MAG: NADP(H)-dependent aldo-keto reductase [Pseudomonadota bacterium]